MARGRNTIEMREDCKNEPISRRGVMLADVDVYVGHIALGRTGDNQDFRRDAPSPSRLMSSRN